jgi:hypothetical protein
MVRDHACLQLLACSFVSAEDTACNAKASTGVVWATQSLQGTLSLVQLWQCNLSHGKERMCTHEGVHYLSCSRELHLVSLEVLIRAVWPCWWAARGKSALTDCVAHFISASAQPYLFADWNVQQHEATSSNQDIIQISMQNVRQNAAGGPNQLMDA